MEEQKQNKHEVIRQIEDRANTTLIWRKSGDPVGSCVGAGDQRFLQRAIFGSALALVILILLGILAYYNVGPLKQAYVVLLIQQGKYQKAEEITLTLTNETAQKSLLQRNYYTCARSLERKGDVVEAVAFYQAAGDYPGALDALQRTGYALAQLYEADGDYQEASETYSKLGDYLDAVERNEGCTYSYAMERYEYGYYDEAMRLFYALGSYMDAEDYAKRAAAALSENEGAGDLVSLLVGLTNEQLSQRARLKVERDALPVRDGRRPYTTHDVSATEAGTVLPGGSKGSGQCITAEWTNYLRCRCRAGAIPFVGLCKRTGRSVAAGQMPMANATIQVQNVSCDLSRARITRLGSRRAAKSSTPDIKSGTRSPGAKSLRSALATIRSAV